MKWLTICHHVLRIEDIRMVQRAEMGIGINVYYQYEGIGGMLSVTYPTEAARDKDWQRILGVLKRAGREEKTND